MAIDCRTLPHVQPQLTSVIDPHSEWLRQITGLIRLADQLNDEDFETIFARVENLERRLALTQARTLKGVRAQLALVICDVRRLDPTATTRIALRSIERSLARMSDDDRTPVAFQDGDHAR